MGLVKDREKWLKFLDEVEEPAVSRLATSPEFTESEAAGRQFTALVLTFHAPPELPLDAVVGMASLLIRRVIDREVELGGAGMTVYPTEVIPGSKRVELRLVPTDGTGANERVAALIAELNAGSRSAKHHQAAGESDLASAISRNSTAPLPESALRYLELVAAA
jgi:hypothetical protein